jgi:hypothetical protein
MTTDQPGPAVEHEELFGTERRYSPPGFNLTANHFVRTVTDDSAENLAELQRRIEEGLFSADAANAIRPASRGQGRARDR